MSWLGGAYPLDVVARMYTMSSFALWIVAMFVPALRGASSLSSLLVFWMYFLRNATGERMFDFRDAAYDRLGMAWVDERGRVAIDLILHVLPAAHVLVAFRDSPVSLVDVQAVGCVSLVWLAAFDPVEIYGSDADLPQIFPPAVLFTALCLAATRC